MSQAAIERQIRPIYDALDASANKSAVQQCNKVLKKYPNVNVVKALKALAIVRMNKVDEALPLCDEVLAAKPTDLETLSAMMHVLRHLGRHSDLVSMYDEAFRKQPHDEEVGGQDFSANVRTGNWKSAQQIATRLHKTFKGDRYLYWTILSAMLQAQDSLTPPAMRTVLHKLAHRLLGGVEVPPYASADRLYLHLSVLRANGLLDEAAALLNTDEGRAISRTNLIVDELRREIVRERDDFEEEGDRARARIVEEKDRNWLEFLAMLDAAFASPDPEHLSKARKLFRELSDVEGTRDRAPLLALIELERRAREKGSGSDFESEDGLLSLLKLYLERFGDKACCFEDLRPYIALEGDELRSVVAHLEGLDHGTNSDSSLRRMINLYKLRRYLLTPAELTAEQEIKRAIAYVRAYVAALPLGKELPETELQPADDLILLAAQAFVWLWKTRNDAASLYMAAAVLEYASQRSKHSYLVRLHLVRIYRLLSAPSLAFHHYRLMNVKQVQNDTLSHFTLARATTFSLAATGDLTFTQECVEASHIYVTNSADTAEFIVRAFHTEKYSQIPDFISFEDRLDNSLQRDLVKMEHVRMRLTHEGASLELVDNELIELKFIFDRTHHDNRDFDVLPNYQPRGQPTFNEQTLMLGNSPGLGWLMTFLRIYIRVFQLASDIDDTVEEKLLVGDRPKLGDSPEMRMPLKERLPMRKDEELSELTSDERDLFDFVMTLCEWLTPYHDYARPPPETVLAEANRLAEQRAGKAPSKLSIGSSPMNGHKKLTEEPPAVKDPPEVVTKYFDGVVARLKEVLNDGHLPFEALHIVTLAQEASLLLALLSIRFKSAAVAKVNKFGALTQSLKTLRQKASVALRNMSDELAKTGSEESTSERRRAFVDSCKPIQEFREFEQDSLMEVAKKIGEARKRVIEGIGKGAAKVASHLS